MNECGLSVSSSLTLFHIKRSVSFRARVEVNSSVDLLSMRHGPEAVFGSVDCLTVTNLLFVDGQVQ